MKILRFAQDDICHSERSEESLLFIYLEFGAACRKVIHDLVCSSETCVDVGLTCLCSLLLRSSEDLLCIFLLEFGISDRSDVGCIFEVYSFSKRLVESFLADDLLACCVDEAAALRHLCEQVITYHALCLRSCRNVHRHEVTFAVKFFDCRNGIPSLMLLGRLRCEDEHIHSEDSERLIITQEAADLINKTKKSGHKVLAVGITTIRGLETYVTTNDEVNAYDGWTNKFIFPPYRFAIPDAIVSNFHRPGSTMLMSVAAFGGYENVMKAYKTALEEDYKFGPYGDALLII